MHKIFRIGPEIDRSDYLIRQMEYGAGTGIRQGKWIGEKSKNGICVCKECSECHEIRAIDKFCSACGARMDADELELSPEAKTLFKKILKGACR